MKSISLFIATVAFTTAAVAAPHSSRDQPIPLDSPEFSGSLNKHEQEEFYSFAAGPGELTITVDVSPNPGDQGVLNYELLAGNGSTVIFCCEYAQGDGGASGRSKKTIKLGKRQNFILHTTSGPIGGGAFNIRLSGAVIFGDRVVQAEPVPTPVDTQGRTSSIVVPANGRLRIELTDGSAQEFDLKRVKKVTVKQ